MTKIWRKNEWEEMTEDLQKILSFIILFSKCTTAIVEKEESTDKESIKMYLITTENIPNG